MPAPTLILLGLRGSGKSTIGRRAAQRLSRPFIDLDDLTPRELGCASVAEAWAKSGEPAFRAAELAVLRRVLASTPQVIALGGGTPTALGAAELLREQAAKGNAILVYLRAEPRILRARLATTDNSHRPPLTPGSRDPLAEIEDVFARRDPLYRSLAGHVLETNALSVQQAVDQVVGLAAANARPPRPTN